MTELDEKPRPIPDRDSEPFWRSISEGSLRLQRCDACETLRWPPRAMCNRCGDFEATWQSTSGRGSLVSWIRTHQVFAPAYRDEVPYVVVQVALEEQPDILMIGGWSGSRDPVSGERVEVQFVERGDGVCVLDWAPAV
jgi:uncharacterized OB-fold protein